MPEVFMLHYSNYCAMRYMEYGCVSAVMQLYSELLWHCNALLLLHDDIGTNLVLCFFSVIMVMNPQFKPYRCFRNISDATADSIILSPLYNEAGNRCRRCRGLLDHCVITRWLWAASVNEIRSYNRFNALIDAMHPDWLLQQPGRAWCFS